MLKPSWSWLVVLSALSIVVVLGVDIFARPEGLSVNLLAGLAGLGAAVLIAVLLLPAFERHVRRQRWERVQRLTYQAIARYLCHIAAYVNDKVPVADAKQLANIAAGTYKPMPRTYEAMKNLVQQTRQLPSSAAIESIVASSYCEIKQMLIHIRDVLLPRVLQSSDDQDVIDALVEFDVAARAFEDSVLVGVDLVAPQKLIDQSASLVEKAAAVYESMLGKW